MSDAQATHNLLIVSDMHVAEGFLPEAGERSFGHDAFLYDGAFARFLRYHQQQRWDAETRLAGGQRPDTDDTIPDPLLLRPWRLIIAGDFIDFWDVADKPGDHPALRQALKEQLQAFQGNQKVVDWICLQLDRLDRVVPTSKIPEQCKGREYDVGLSPPDYHEVRDGLDRLGLEHGPQRRAFEQLAWWTESLLLKEGLKLTTRERRHGLGTTWQEVLWKLTLVYRGHRELFAALAWFIACGNEVVLLKGNHDLELYWPQVHQGHLPHLLVDAYRDLLDGAPVGPTLDQHPLALAPGAPDLDAFKGLLPHYTPGSEADTRAAGMSFHFEQWIYYEKDHVYVEHGNQYEPLDSSESFLAPEWPREGEPRRIELPWGGFMARYVYNKIVAVHPFAVNIKPESRIIHWMINNDFFRVIGIVLAELPDAVEALRRALVQGLRGGWIWGDRSILGLIALGAADYEQLRHPRRTERAQEVKKRHTEGRYRMAGVRQLPGDSAESATAGEGNPTTLRLLVNLGLYALASGLVVILVVAGVYWLIGSDLPGWWIPALAAWGSLLVLGIIYGLAVTGVTGWHTLGELLLQLGAAGMLVLLTAAIFLAGGLGWGKVERWLLLLIPLGVLLLGVLVLWASRQAVVPEPGPRGLFPDWQANAIRSSGSLLRELGSAALLACAFRWACTLPSVAISCRDKPEPYRWLGTALTLLLLSWLAGKTHAWYVNRWRADPLRTDFLDATGRIIRVIANVLVGLSALGVLVAVLGSFALWAASSIQEAMGNGSSSQGLRELLEALSALKNTLTGVDAIGLSPLSLMLLGIGIVILLQLFLAWILQKLRDRQKDSAALGQSAVQRGTGLSLAEQLRAIEALARAEQRRWSGGLGEMLTLLLPFVSATVLIIFVAGIGATLLSVTGSLEREIEKITAYVGVLAAAVFWVLRQLSASVQGHDLESGFGDLFPRVATSVADILALGYDQEEADGFGRPRYFIFGHDHWADAKPLHPGGVPYGTESTPAQQQWYVNSGTWLRGYVAEQREQEVSENHSTFVQIVTGMEQGATPRVLRWNDSAGQPERIVRRDKALSANELLWTRWSVRGWRVLLWLILIGALVLIGWVTSTEMLIEGLWPLLWALVLWWPVSSYLMKFLRYLGRSSRSG